MNRKNTMKFMVVFVGALAAGMTQPSVAAEAEPANVSQVVSRLKESVRSKWGKLSALCGRTTELRAEMEYLPESVWIGSDKKSQRELIHEKIKKIRSLLLSTDAQEIMERVDELDERIADIDKDIHKENAKGVFCPDRGEKTASALSKLREKRRNLVCQREDAVRAVLKEVEALGLRLSGGAAEQCLFMVDARDLIDAVVVTKSIGIVVDDAAKMLLVAENSYKTVTLADDFRSLIKSTQDSFEALLQLQLPPIEIFNDTALQAEFAALTKRLAEGEN